jgi:hypothetical protein
MKIVLVGSIFFQKAFLFEIFYLHIVLNVCVFCLCGEGIIMVRFKLTNGWKTEWLAFRFHQNFDWNKYLNALFKVMFQKVDITQFFFY